MKERKVSFIFWVLIHHTECKLLYLLMSGWWSKLEVSHWDLIFIPFKPDGLVHIKVHRNTIRSMLKIKKLLWHHILTGLRSCSFMAYMYQYTWMQHLFLWSGELCVTSQCLLFYRCLPATVIFCSLCILSLSLFCSPPNLNLDVRKSSYKKLNKFLSFAQNKGLVEVKETSKGVDSLVSFDGRHDEWVILEILLEGTS